MKYKDEEKKLAAFTQLKTALAPCIESAMLLDRVCYLQEQVCLNVLRTGYIFYSVTEISSGPVV